MFLFSSFFYLLFLKTGFLCVIDMAILKPWPQHLQRDALNLCLPSAGIKTMCHHTWLLCLVFSFFLMYSTLASNPKITLNY